MKRLLILAVAIAFPYLAWAHGGEDHGDATAPLPTTSNAVRMSSTSDQFELVGVLEGKVLTIYLDQYATNAPVTKAQIELESAGWKGNANEVAPAVYVVSSEALAQPGKHPIAITVQAGDTTDLMDAILEVGLVKAGAIGLSTPNIQGNGACGQVPLRYFWPVLDWFSSADANIVVSIDP